MDLTHLHLLLNHFPILGTLFGFCLLAYGLIRSNKTLENAGLVTFIIITLITIPAFMTGEEAEETVESLQGVSEYYIEQHEEIAEIALWLMVSTGSLALLTFIVSKIKDNRALILKTITVFLAAGTFGLMTAVGNYGGKIRHNELREKAIYQTNQNDKPGEFKNVHDEDD